MTSLSELRTRLWRGWRVLEAYSGLMLKIAGVTVFAASIFEFGSWYALASEPRLFLFWMGLFMWASGGLARSEQKEANRLERKLERCREQRDEYEQRYRDAIAAQYEEESDR